MAQEFQINPDTQEVQETTKGKGFTGRVFSSREEAQGSLKPATDSILPGGGEIVRPPQTPGGGDPNTGSLVDGITAPAFSPFDMDEKEEREANRLAAQKEGINIASAQSEEEERARLETTVGRGEAFFGKTIGLGASNVSFGILEGMRAQSEKNLRTIRQDKQAALLAADTASYDRLDLLEAKELERSDLIAQRTFENQMSILTEGRAERGEEREDKRLEHDLDAEDRQIASELRQITLQYPDAGITADDDFATAMKKLKESDSYKRAVEAGRLMEVGGGLYRLEDDGSLKVVISPRVASSGTRTTQGSISPEARAAADIYKQKYPDQFTEDGNIDLEKLREKVGDSLFADAVLYLSQNQIVTESSGEAQQLIDNAITKGNLTPSKIRGWARNMSVGLNISEADAISQLRTLASQNEEWIHWSHIFDNL